jgi:hypothetical protein
MIYCVTTVAEAAALKAWLKEQHAVNVPAHRTRNI